MAIPLESSADQDQRISEVLEDEGGRLWRFIRSRVPDTADAEEVLQEVFYELIEAYRLTKPIEQVSAWLFRIARNRITDLFRRRNPESLNRPVAESDNGDQLSLEDLLPSPRAGPDALYARQVLTEAMEEALDDLSPEQRDVFIAHELEGKSFKEICAETGVGINTLLARKRYAVLHLRRRLQSLYDEYLR